jgi:hypothetical protein
MRSKIIHGHAVTANDIEIYNTGEYVFCAIFPAYDGFGGQLYADYELSGSSWFDVHLHDYIDNEEKKYLRTFPKVDFESVPERVQTMINQDLQELNSKG